jgi:toxin ParE1/3/4
MYALVLKPRAIEMAKEAYEWYEEQQTGLGDLFLRELERCYDKLESGPALYNKIKKNFRQIILKTFPYVVVFEIDNNDVVIYAVFHTSRNSRKKFKK